MHIKNNSVGVQLLLRIRCGSDSRRTTHHIDNYRYVQSRSIIYDICNYTAA